MCFPQWNENYVSKCLPLALCLHLCPLSSMTDTWTADGANWPRIYLKISRKTLPRVLGFFDHGIDGTLDWLEKMMVSEMGK